jgi:pimeloyl-ACP methyl ester carboxylesterase
MRIQNGDVGLNVVVDGADDAPPILLLHGILGSSCTWDWMVPRLTDRYRVLRLDFRGHGESDRASGTYQLTDYVSDAAAVCEQIAGAPCVVIGHSLGGATAAGLAQTRPDLVRGVVLEDAPLAMPDPQAEGAERNSLMDVFALLREAIPQMQAAGMSLDDVTAVVAASPSASGGVLGELLHDDGVATMAASMMAVDASVLDRVLDRVSDEPLTVVFDADRALPVPAAVVAADPTSPDAVTRPADLAKMAANSPHASTHTMSGANHLIHDTIGQREPFWSIVEQLLASLS